ncbi:alpha/beta hydrolase family protein [Dyadobacter arcticus]|uniref:Dienelactone hydrolase n=1 Tax=Dyadobacter arcticus TaxID=1078754 RepID=A0ABX0UT10_9BACT|nr:alpha/beta hydrolase family protein [Dyadobacter arcticus]NIJ55902.1 dienelactone hydrolase [Dyadobacter arcticus]
MKIENKEGPEKMPRRAFLKTTAYTSALPLLMGEHYITGISSEQIKTINNFSMSSEKSLIGGYGPWAVSLLPKVPPLSFRNDKWKDLASWKKQALGKTMELVSSPPKVKAPAVTVVNKYVYDGLEIEELTWQMPYGRPTSAILLKPQGVSKPLPAVLGLHDHAGKKYFGYRKIVKTSDDQHPLLKEHQETNYEGKAWANEIAKRGYVVLVNDAFAFGSRRVFYEDVKGLDWGEVKTTGKSDIDPEKSENIETYNTWSSEHEHVMSKSLFCAGTTWPGVFLSEDQIALDILSARKDVDSNRIGCGGLSGGGLRTVYLAGLDPRIKCAVCVGFMTTWNDLILNKSFNHTWMTYTPLLPQYLDFPEIIGLRVPLPTLVLNNNQDELYTLAEMKKADNILTEVFKKAKASEKYAAKFYDGPHKFDAKMQADAFEWFDKWL